MSKTIDKLTKEQEAQIPVYLEKYLAIGLSTQACDHAKAEAAVAAYYTHEKLPVPKFVWAPCPEAGAFIAAQLAKGSEDVTDDEIRAQAHLASYGSFEAYWVAFYDYITTELLKEKNPLVQFAKDIVENCGVYWTFEDIVVMTEKPTEIHMKDQKLHNPNGLALKYPDGSGIVAINGQRLPSLMKAAIADAMDET